MLEIEFSNLPDEIWFAVVEEFKQDFPEQEKIKVLPQSKLIIINQDSNHVKSQVIQSISHHVSDQVVNYSDYSRQKEIELIENGYKIREI